MTQYPSLLRGLAAGSVFLFPFAPMASAMEQTVETPSVNACAWVLMDYTSGKVLAEGSADKKLDPVSLIKIMTSYVVEQAFEADKIELTDMVTVGKDAQATGNPTLRGSPVMFLESGGWVSVTDLNKDVIIQSGNGTCIMLADYVAGSRELFTGSINGYIEKLGLTNTTFQAMHDLDAPGRSSTARDTALLGKTLIHDVLGEYAIRKEKEFTFNKTRRFNRNRLLWSSNLNADGMKTGTTAGAEYNLIASTTQGDMRLVPVVLEAKTDRIRFSESEELLTRGFRFSETVMPTRPDATFVTQRVWLGDKSEVNLGTGEAGSMTILRRQLKSLKASCTLTEPQLTAPLKKGQVIGTINFQPDDKPIEQCPLTVMGNVEEDEFFGRI